MRELREWIFFFRDFFLRDVPGRLGLKEKNSDEK